MYNSEQCKGLHLNAQKVVYNFISDNILDYFVKI